MFSTVRPSTRSPWLALVVLCAGMLMIILDQTIVNVALPTIQDDLGFSQAGLAWVVNAYLIAFGGLLLLAGRVGDLVGRKRVFLAGMVLFTLASVICGAATTASVLVVARFVQGVGGALTSSVILGMIVTMFPGKAEQSRALGVYSFVAAGGASIGLLAGGVLTQAVNWHWIFFVNVPIGVAALLLGVRLIADDRGIGLSGGADLPGALLVIAAVSVGVFTVVGAADHGWTSQRTLGLAAVSVALLAGFLAREATARTPLVPLGVFRERALSVANLIQFLMVAGLIGMFFLGALYLQRVLGFSAIQVGGAFLPVAVSIAALSLRITPWLVTRFGPRPVLVPGLVLIGLGLAGFARVPVNASYPVDVLAVMLVLGIGAGLSFPALMELAMTGSSEHDSGLRSGLANTTLQVGGAFGLAVLATLSTRRTAGLLAHGAEQAEALTGGFRLAFAVGAGFVLVALALAVFGLRAQRSARAEDPEAVEELQPV